MDFDLQLAKEESAENPVYYIQYAYARIASILRNAGELARDGGDVLLLTGEPELALVRKMLELPEVIEKAAANLEPGQTGKAKFICVSVRRPGLESPRQPFAMTRSSRFGD